jgi:hypothetical protein
MTIQELAKEVIGFMDSKDGKNGKKIYVIRKNTPEWVSELVFDAVPEITPDNFIFKNVYHFLQSLAQGKSPEEITLEPDNHLFNQVQWLLGHKFREVACDNIVLSGDSVSLKELFEKAQIEELESIKSSVHSTLLNEIENRKESSDEQ